MIESVRTPEPRVQGQGICPVCDFASRPATKEQTAFRRQPVTSLPLVPTSFPLVPEIRQRVSHSLIARADRTNGREMLCSPELNNKDTRIQQRSATMFAVYLCPTRNTLGWSGTKRKRKKRKKKKKNRKNEKKIFFSQKKT